MTKTVRAHKVVRSVAVGLAHELYAQLMQENETYSKLKAKFPAMSSKQLETFWVKRAWPTLLLQARATLAQMLNGNYPDNLKLEIHDALVKDNMLRKGSVKTVLFN